VKITKQQLYKRQTILSEFGEAGQQKLQNAKVVVVGCGGLGSIAAVSLAASGVGNICLIDFDVVDISNLPRQIFYKTEDIGKPKAQILANHIKAITPFVKITTSNKAITKTNIFDKLSDYQVVVDCTDSLATKYLLNDFCVITNKILVYGSLYKNDGYVASFNIKENSGRSANLRNAFPEIPKNSIPNCSEVGTLNPIVGIIGLMQANEVIKIITQTGTILKNQILIFNATDNSQFRMKLNAENENFDAQNILKIFDASRYEDTNCEVQNEALLISAKALKETLGNKDQIIISVIENVATKLPFDVSEIVPFSKFDTLVLKIDFSKKYVLVCNRGVLSYAATKKLKNSFPKLHVLSLKGGITKY